MHPIPLQLQTQYRFFADQDSSSVLIGAAVLVAFVVLLAVLNRFSSGLGSGGTKGSRFTFRRYARSLGLSKPQLLTLERLAASYRIAMPARLLESPALLDSVLRKEIQRSRTTRDSPRQSGQTEERCFPASAADRQGVHRKKENRIGPRDQTEPGASVHHRRSCTVHRVREAERAELYSCRDVALRARHRDTVSEGDRTRRAVHAGRQGDVLLRDTRARVQDRPGQSGADTPALAPGDAHAETPLPQA